jgi:hypothetical protein
MECPQEIEGASEVNLRVARMLNRWKKFSAQPQLLKSGVSTSLRSLFAFFGVNECNGDL